MRSLLLVIATLVLVICGFVIYSQMQSPVAPRAAERGGAQGPASAPAGGGPDNVMGPGKDPWVRQFDEKTAELKSQFKAARYERQADGTMLVEKPVAEFMLGRGRFVRIEGTRGSVVMPDTKVVEGGEVQPPTIAPPSRGQLHDVVISLFDEPAAEGRTPEPSLTVAMNNTAFDNDTFLITTEAFTDGAGNRVEADQVPVKVRGRDYDFDGRGLRIQWNELSQRLQLLEIAHGQSLTVKDRGKLEELQNGTPTSAPAPAPDAAAGRRRKNRPTGAVASTAPTTRPIVPYRASFEKDLRITEGDAELATGSLMQVDFVMEKGDGDETAGAAAASQDGAIAAGRKTARRPRAAAAPTTNPTTAPEPTTAPAVQPAEPLPIVVHWTGRLRVMPLELSDEPPLGADQQIIRFSGEPLKLYRDGADIEAAGATFHTADGSASLRSSDDVPRVTLRSADGAVVATPALTYAEENGTATLTGPSRADIPMGAGDSTESLSATWNDEAIFSLPKDERGEAVIRHANIKGSVAIAHPRIDLNSDALELAFAAPATQPAGAQPTTRQTPNLEKLIAAGGVLAKLKDPNGPPRSIQSRTLEMQTLATPGGQLLPRTIIADGDVLLTEPTQSMRADHLTATLKPKPTTAPAVTPEPSTQASTRPADDTPEMVVESIVAQGAVRLDGEKGAYAKADQLMAAERDEASEVKLMGNAEVSDGRSRITGPVLTMRPKEQKAEVPGAGTLTFLPDSKEGAAPKPVHVAWTGHAALDGKTNLVDLDQGVTFNTTGDDGMATSAKSNHLQIALTEKPTTQPTTESAAAPAAPATRPSGGGLGDLQDMDFLANKEARSAKLTGDVQIESTLLNAEGGVERRMYMSAGEANYDLASRQMIVPVNGRLLYEDHRPPEAQQDENEGPANRGTTAFEWRHHLTYDDARQQVVMEGDVDINHVPDAQGGESFRIATQRVTAELEPRPTTAPATTSPATAPTTAPTTDPPTKPSPVPAAMRLKRVTADGGVNVRTKRFQFTATTLSYDPTTGVLTARGTPDAPVTLTDDKGEIDSSIESLTWNTKTDQINLKRGRGRVRP